MEDEAGTEDTGDETGMAGDPCDPAADALDEMLGRLDFHPMAAPVISNVEADANFDRERVRGLLVRQVTSRVRWWSSVKKAV
ncbi:MAG: ACP S-malonyltransferase, partial [Myxococcales bacterium]|nr:ACP S-malonyltransferase [Myxococcales bacterium]